MNKQIEIIFNSVIIHLYKDRPEVMRFLLNHERKNMVLVHTVQQINIAERSNIGKRFDATKHSMLIQECAKLFCRVALSHKEQQLLSHAETVRRIDDANRMANIEAEFEAEQKEFLSKKIISFPSK